MKGLYLHSATESQNHGENDQWLTLLAKRGNFEVMTQKINRGATAWLYPAENTADMEFFFVHSGKMEIVMDEGETLLIVPGDSFHTQGLRGAEIPLAARILMVADSFDAMTSDRGYNRVKSFEDAAAEIMKSASRYDPEVARLLWDMVQSGRIKKEE